MENFFDENNIVSTLKETDKKCPNCDGVMNYDPKTGGMLCEFCGHTEAVEAKESIKKAEEQDFESALNVENCDWGVEKKTILCKFCGGEAIYDALQTSGECPFCGSNQVMEAATKDTLAPNGVIPFVIDKKSCGQRFTNWIKGKLFCPNEAKKNARPEAFQGVYLPYWTFDAQTRTEYTAEYGINRTVRDRQGNTKTVTDWYRTAGVHNQFINDQIVIGTNRHKEYLIKKIEPFDTNNAIEYKPEYVSGFVSERYSTGLKSAWEKAKEYIKTKLRSAINSKVRSEKGADELRNLAMDTAFSGITYKYLMLPVWISSFKYNGKVYQFYVNGQTGKVGGNAPISPYKVGIAILIVAIVVIMLWNATS